jgi:hypothetical protein
VTFLKKSDKIFCHTSQNTLGKVHYLSGGRLWGNRGGRDFFTRIEGGPGFFSQDFKGGGFLFTNARRRRKKNFDIFPQTRVFFYLQNVFTASQGGLYICFTKARRRRKLFLTFFRKPGFFLQIFLLRRRGGSIFFSQRFRGASIFFTYFEGGVMVFFTTF